MSKMTPHVLLVSLDRGIRWESPKGASIHLRMMCRGLKSRDARVSLIVPDGVAHDVHDIDVPCFSRIPGAAAVRRYHKGEGREGAELAALALRSHAFEAARQLHDDDPIDLVYERYSLFSDVGARLAESISRPLALEVNAPLIEEQSRYRELIMHRAAELIERRQLTGATRVLAVSRSVARWAESRGAPAERTRVMPNTAERSMVFREHFRAPLESQPFVIGFSGSLKPWHGIGEFLEVFARVHADRPRARLELLGDGPLRADLEERVAELGLDDVVRFLGHVPFAEVPDALARWHLVVAPYPPLDGFYFSPLKVVEALAAGRPVMASALGDIPELLDGGRRGVLVEAGDARGWHAELVTVMDAPERLAPIAEAAERTTRSWSWAGHAESVLAEALPVCVTEARNGS